MTGYRLGSWRSYRHKTGIIRTTVTWRGDIGGKISRKVASGQITEEKNNAINAFLWEKYRAFCFNV
jgi:hypothetical protein